MIAMLQTPRCRRCGRGRVNRPRGLCWKCFYTPGVRESYGPVDKYGRRGIGIGIGYRCAPLPIPTRALPGTPEKLSVLESRAAAGECLWHPADGSIDVS